MYGKKPSYGRSSYSHSWELLVIVAMVALIVAIVMSL
jgi:hypothetical protein